LKLHILLTLFSRELKFMYKRTARWQFDGSVIQVSTLGGRQMLLLLLLLMLFLVNSPEIFVNKAGIIFFQLMIRLVVVVA